LRHSVDYYYAWADDGDTETPGEEEEDETAKNPVTPAVTAGSKERRKPFFRRVSKALTPLLWFVVDLLYNKSLIVVFTHPSNPGWPQQYQAEPAFSKILRI